MEIEAIVKFKHSYANDILVKNGYSISSFADAYGLNKCTFGNFLRLKSSPGPKIRDKIFFAFQNVEPSVDYLKLFPLQLKVVTELFGSGRRIKKEIDIERLIDNKTDVLQIEDQTEFRVLEQIDAKKLIDSSLKAFLDNLSGNKERALNIIKGRMDEYTWDELSKIHNISIERARQIFWAFGRFTKRYESRCEIINSKENDERNYLDKS